jgi:hypothetical protein
MVLAKRHVQRLWYPEPGQAGAIPSRSEHALSKAAFDALLPREFWRDVVDRVAQEAPDTLLLAEAFWLMEGYFVRTLGMHRVYNSAFMHMIRDEDNAEYRKVIRDTLEFDPAILGRYVNFLTNPDEETAIEQFGTGDKYFGATTLLATMPGLPMIGHGQVEGFTEKYGMEFQRARLDEQANKGLMARFDAEIVPLLRDRQRFAASTDFRLYDVIAGDGSVIDAVFAYSNGRGADRSLVVHHNRFGSVAGWIRESVSFAVKGPSGKKRQRRDTLGGALGLGRGHGRWLRFRDTRTQTEFLRSVDDIRDRGLFIDLQAYEYHVFVDFEEVTATAETPWDRLAGELGGKAVPSLDAALADLRFRPIHDAARALLEATTPDQVVARWEAFADQVGMPGTPSSIDPETGDRAVRAAHRLGPIGRARFDELRLATALRQLGLGEPEVIRTRLAVGLARPSSVGDAAALANAWLADPDVRSFLEIHEWEGSTWLSKERWQELLALATDLDRVAGPRRTPPVIERLRDAAETSGYRIDRLIESLRALGKHETASTSPPRRTAGRSARTSTSRTATPRAPDPATPKPRPRRRSTR